MKQGRARETDSPNATRVYYVCLTFINFFSAREFTMLSIGDQSSNAQDAFEPWIWLKMEAVAMTTLSNNAPTWQSRQQLAYLSFLHSIRCCGEPKKTFGRFRLENDYLLVATSRSWMESHRQFNWHAWSTNNQGGLWNRRPRFYTESFSVQNAFHHSVNTRPCQLCCTSLPDEYINTAYTSFGMAHCVNF